VPQSCFAGIVSVYHRHNYAAEKRKALKHLATLNMRGKKRGLFSGLVQRTKISVEFSSCHFD